VGVIVRKQRRPPAPFGKRSQAFKESMGHEASRDVEYSWEIRAVAVLFSSSEFVSTLSSVPDFLQTFVAPHRSHQLPQLETYKLDRQPG
jgi:hypothetical protein